MSFTTEIKTELCKIEGSTCCKLAECYGILLLGRSFTVDNMSLTTESEDVVFRLTSLLGRCFGTAPNISVSGNKKDLFTITIEPKKKREEILNAFGYFGFKDGDSIIKYHNIEDDCCKSAFLRGVFLSTATFSDPNREYHAELPINNKELAKEVYELLQIVGLSPKLSTRGKKLAVYFTGSENISDVLAFLGAGSYSLKLADITVYKDFRNRQNRITNCETANITKTVNAAVSQCMAIKALKENGIFYKLSPELQKVGTLRLENDQASLSELCELYDGDISKSGLNHRLNRLVALSKTINK